MVTALDLVEMLMMVKLSLDHTGESDAFGTHEISDCHRAGGCESGKRRVILIQGGDGRHSVLLQVGPVPDITPSDATALNVEHLVQSSPGKYTLMGYMRCGTRWTR